MHLYLPQGGDNGDCLASIQLAVDWVCGGAGGLADQEQAARLDRFILAGDSLAESTRDRAGQTTARYGLLWSSFSAQLPVLWIQNDLFRIRLRVPDLDLNPTHVI